MTCITGMYLLYIYTPYTVIPFQPPQLIGPCACPNGLCLGVSRDILRRKRQFDTSPWPQVFIPVQAFESVPLWPQTGPTSVCSVSGALLPGPSEVS